MAGEVGNLKQAVVCYGKAAQLLPKDPAVIYGRAIAMSDTIEALPEGDGTVTYYHIWTHNPRFHSLITIYGRITLDSTPVLPYMDA